MKSATLTLIALLVALLSANAIGCGESLYRVGKGVSYREYTAPLPGNLLIYAPSAGSEQLARELARSGHTVNLVDTADQMVAEIAGGDYDVVIAPYSEHEKVESGSSVAKIDYLPIAFSREEARHAKASFDAVMQPDKHELKHYLKAIHIALKRRA